MNNVKIGSRTDRHGEPDASQPASSRLRKVGIDQRKEDDSGRVLDLGNHPIELRLRCAPADRHARSKRRPDIAPPQRARRRSAFRRSSPKPDEDGNSCGPMRPPGSITAGYNQPGGMWTGVEKLGATSASSQFVRRTGRARRFTAVPVGSKIDGPAKTHLNCGDN